MLGVFLIFERVDEMRLGGETFILLVIFIMCRDGFVIWLSEVFVMFMGIMKILRFGGLG